MDWIDTLMLEPTTEEFSAGHGASATGDADESAHAVSARLVAVQGISLLQAEGTNHREAEAALELLRGFRATGRRVVFCDSSSLVAGRQLGFEMVESGATDLLVSCGKQGRDLAIGARDAGLGLSSVIVCQDANAASEVLTCHLVSGDTVLLWGVKQTVCDDLIVKLENRLTTPVRLAA